MALIYSKSKRFLTHNQEKADCMSDLNIGNFDLEEKEGIKGALKLMDLKIVGVSNQLTTIEEGIAQQKSSLFNVLISLILAVFAFFGTVGSVLYFFIKTDHELNIKLHKQEIQIERISSSVINHKNSSRSSHAS